jgi:hypothetical protein
MRTRLGHLITVDCTNVTTKKNGLTWAGLLMEVARYT